jgi:predicted nucleotidyltransferase
MIARMPATPELEKVIALLEERFGLEALIVFGSVARVGTHVESDIDLAGLFRTPPDPVALIEAGADCERLLGRSVDLVDLAAASPILAMQVMRDGKCVLGAESTVLAHFAASLPSRYADLKRVRAAAEAALADRIARARS